MYTEKYLFCNHHHELTDEYEIVNFGDGEFVANKEGIPLLKALNEIGLKTRTHHITKHTEEDPRSFVSIIIDDDMTIEFKTIFENDATRTQYNGKKEILISWKSQNK